MKPRLLSVWRNPKAARESGNSCSTAVAALVFLLSSVFASSGETLPLQPAADTYFEAYGSENRNFGRDPVLRIDQWGGRQAFLRFNLLQAHREKRVRKAVLRLYVSDIGFNERGEFPELKTCISILDVTTPWTEIGLTFSSPDGLAQWHQGPGIPGPKYGDVGPLGKSDVGIHLKKQFPFTHEQASKNSWLEFDLTGFVSDQLLAGAEHLNLVVRGSTLGRNYTLRSREAEESSQRPELVIVFDETLSAVALRDKVIVGWGGGSVSMEAELSAPGQGAKGLAWGLKGRPAVSRLGTNFLNWNGKEAEIRADVPGRYRVELDGAPHINASVDVLELRAHPRLYVTSESLTSLRASVARQDRLASAFLKWVDAGKAGGEQGKFHDMGPHEGCENTALAWLITEKPEYLGASLAYARRMLTKPMPQHFSDVHDATFAGAGWVHAMALHYDWLYQELPETHRAAVADWLIDAANWSWARSGAPIAHNDGGARQCLLASAALALLGDRDEAEELHQKSRDNFEFNLMPWLNDGGRGGRSGDGGEYEGLHAFYLVRYAWLSQSATGEDIFSESPFFFNRLNHIRFGWYPRRLVEKNGAFSMRQYYSPSGDHIRMGYVGDTQPYQSAAALCARYRNTPEARGVRWLGGDWPTGWMQYTMRWALLGEWEAMSGQEPAQLEWFDRGCNTVYMRSDWTDDATWILFENAPYVSAHGSLDSGTFEIFKGDLLAARTGNLDHANVGAKHTMNYLHRSIAGNCLLINDPDEKWKGFLGGADGIHDGGGQRTNFPLGSSPEVDEYAAFRDVFQRGQITRYTHQPQVTYACADLTPAYNNEVFHGGKLNRPKVRNVSRQLAYLRGLDVLVVFDRVSSVDPNHKKTWVLHSLGELDVLDGNETTVDAGELHYQGASRALIRHGWPKPVPSFAQCLSVTLLPTNTLVSRIGGREPLEQGRSEGFSGDQWHGKHQHRHVKDFWVNGTNYPPGNPPETRWFGEPGSSFYVPGTPDESGGRGKWRIEVSPGTAAQDDVFLHVLCPRLEPVRQFPSVSGWSNGSFEGAMISEAGRTVAVCFSRDETRQQRFSTDARLPEDSVLIVADLNPGSYTIRNDTGEIWRQNVGDDGLLVLVRRVRGSVEITRE